MHGVLNPNCTSQNPIKKGQPSTRCFGWVLPEGNTLNLFLAAKFRMVNEDGFLKEVLPPV
jgi:hypothetical protein